MNRTAIAFLTRDRVELSRQSIEPLLQPNKFDLWWIDGSDTSRGENLALDYPTYIHVHGHVRGGADAAVAYALTTLLAKTEPGSILGAHYDYIGVTENDVLLDNDWFEPTMALFNLPDVDLEVGAVSARSYEDRILCQRDGYMLAHNLGYGCQIFTRQAAQLWLDNFRTCQTMEPRRIYAQLTGLDIGSYWAFRGGQHPLVSDWYTTAFLASQGLASLSLTPAKCRMIGQDLASQGLALVSSSVDALRSDEIFTRFAGTTREIREGNWSCGIDKYMRQGDASVIFPHQLPAVGGEYRGDWALQWSQGFGPFAWAACGARGGDAPTLDVPLSGPVTFLVSGGKTGGQVRVCDTRSGYEITPALPAEGGQVMQLMVPAGVSHRTIRLTALDPGVVFYGVMVREPQPEWPRVKFDWKTLPSAGEL